MAAKKRSARRSRKLSTREYGRPIVPKSQPRRWNYVYSKGAGGDRGKRPSYPIYDLAHARNALARAASPRTAGSVSTVKAALRKKGGQFAALANRSHAGRR